MPVRKTAAGFSADLKKFAKRMDIEIAVVRKRVAFDIFGSLIKRTPFDTGRARASWTMADTSPDLQYTAPVGGRSGSQAAGEARASVSAKFLLPFDVTIITNNLPYIRALENGHSKKAANGMVAIALAEAEAGIISAGGG